MNNDKGQASICECRKMRKFKSLIRQRIVKSRHSVKPESELTAGGKNWIRPSPNKLKYVFQTSYENINK
jgi:hypothetical protein